MLKIRNIILLISAILFFVNVGDAAFRSSLGSGGGRNYNNRQQYSNNYNYKTSNSNVARFPNQDTAHTADLKSTNGNDVKGVKVLSAWGIVAIVIGVILLGTGGYYAFVFYPFICRKERNYDMIELTNVL